MPTPLDAMLAINGVSQVPDGLVLVPKEAIVEVQVATLKKESIDLGRKADDKMKPMTLSGVEYGSQEKIGIDTTHSKACDFACYRSSTKEECTSEAETTNIGPYGPFNFQDGPIRSTCA
ncbi:hypothetical protein COLO4_13227 [Corchorus olitorius]|uniref:Uncharacterized protein n=1 Tax=Corchorus olitorius TaxID=93759 RepID=A0A1R3JXX3_9ROSI|nr:hypothetical protein COLO4_13227 [Corchorus olitorius]